MTVRDQHAAFAPSSMAITIQCPGSWKLQQLYPAKDDTVEAAEGVAAHWVMAQALMGKLPEVNSIAPNGVPVTDEMLDGAEMYVDAVGIDPSNVIEQTLPACEELGKDCWGTPDTYRYKPIPVPDTNIVGGVIVISDYKFGHRFVDVFENWQLVTYAILIINALKIDALAEQHTRIVFKIVQPRCYDPRGPVREWSVLASDLRAQWNKIRSAILVAWSDSAMCHVGPECHDCTARAHCPTLHRATQAALDEVGKPTPMELPAGAMGYQLRAINHAIEILKARHSGLEEVALEQIKAGRFVPGFGLRQGTGRERWKVPTSQVESLGKTMGLKLTEPRPITPKQAVKAGLDVALVREFTETPIGKLSLIEDDGSIARNAFGNK